MRPQRGHERSANDATRAQIAAAGRLRDAFGALLKDAKAARMYAGSGIDAQGARDRFQSTFLGGIHDALTHLQMIMLEVTADAMFLGDAIVLEGTERRGDVLEVLFSEGVRGISIEAGASDDELMAMARLMLTPWHEHGPDDVDLQTAAWQADFAHIFFEVVEGLSDESQDGNFGESPVVRELAGLVREINARANEDGETARVRQDEFAVLLRLQDQIHLDVPGEGDSAPRLDVAVSPALAAEVRACRDNVDLDNADIAGLLATCLRFSDDPRRGGLIGEALFSYLVNVTAISGGESRLIHKCAELLDPELTPDLPHQDAVRDASAILAQEPIRSRLGRMFEAGGADQLSGVAFSIFLLLPGEDEATALAESLPPWAVRVLADTVLLRASGEPLLAIDVAKRFLAAEGRGSTLLGLAMAARQNDPRLIEVVLAQIKGPADDVREAALVALRQHQTPKVRQAVRLCLDDPAELVRMESLRAIVAYRDVEMVAKVEARLMSAADGEASADELRALCIAFARLVPDRAEALLVEWATAKRESRHAELPRLALHGIRAIGTPGSRSTLERIAHTVPTLAPEAQALLARER